MVHCDQPAPEDSRLPFSGSGARDRQADRPLRRLITGALRFYKLAVSPWLPSACRFHPTCSEYMRDAVQSHGVGRGLWLGLRRLAKCHPFHPGGVDLVP